MIVLICQYVFSIPLGYVFAVLLKQDLAGIWEGMLVGVVLQGLCFFGMLIFRVDWAKTATDINNKFMKSLIEKPTERTKSVLTKYSGIEEAQRGRADSRILYDSRVKSYVE